MERLDSIYYEEPGESFTYCILAPNVNGAEYVKKLNSRIEKFNIDAERLNELEKELRVKHKLNASFEDITGAERLNEREPKYPAQFPKGLKNPQAAYPEIFEERARRKTENEKNWKIYADYTNNAREQVKLDSKALKTELLERWPEFKTWINSESYDRHIYGKFELNQSRFKYVTEELV